MMKLRAGPAPFSSLGAHGAHLMLPRRWVALLAFRHRSASNVQG